MKKKYSLLIFSLIYVISLTAGFSYAGFRRAAEATPAPVENRQSNLILVRVDDMSLVHPQLVSVWAMFLSFAPGPQIFFKPIYTADTTSSPALKLAHLFRVNADRTIAADFIQELDHLNIQRTGMVILDDTGFHSFTSWLTNTANVAATNLFVPTTGESTSRYVSPEALVYNNICSALQHPNTSRALGLAWNELVPGHILPHPNLETLAGIWERILTSSIPSHCEVIAN